MTDSSTETAHVTRSKSIAPSIGEPKIIDQIASYSKSHTDIVLNELTNEYEEQKQINTILKEKNFQENKEEIESFVNEKADIITNQVSEMENLFKDFKKLYAENQELHENQQEYNDINNTQEVKKISKEMRRLKTLKNEVIAFLQTNGLRDTN